MDNSHDHRPQTLGEAIFPAVFLALLFLFGLVLLWGQEFFFNLLPLEATGHWLMNHLPEPVAITIGLAMMFAWFCWPATLALVGVGLYRIVRFCTRSFRGTASLVVA